MKFALLVWLVVACAASAQSEARESRIVQTAQGPVRGYKNDKVFEFMGIPYAKAPTGKDRFKVRIVCLTKKYHSFVTMTNIICCV